MCLVKPDGPPQLCKTDEIGEIIVNSRAGGNMYYGLPGVTKNTFEVRKRNLNLEHAGVVIHSEKRRHFFWLISRLAVIVLR